LDYFGKKGLFGWIVERLTAKLTNMNIAVSEATKRGLLSIGVKKASIQVIPNGVSFKEFLNIKPSEEEFDIIFVGRLIKERNIDVLLRSIGILKGDMPQIKVAIIGGGPEFNKLKKLAVRLGIEDNVKFFGFIEDFKTVISIMKSSKVFMHPSTREGGGSIVTLEANACGLPVIAIKCDLRISPELIKEGFNGFFIELSPEKMASTIKLLLEDSKLRNQMSKNAMESSKQFDWDVIADISEKFYERVSNGR
jgi:glycosyltransferase involved in cell wall biosynthesis